MEANNGNNRAALRALTQEYMRLQGEELEGFRVNLVEDNYFLWEVGIFGPPDTLYAGGYFRAQLTFPHDYPFSPPTMRFLTKMWHPNIYKTGKVCISILQSVHNNDTKDHAAERWNPCQNVRTILLSVISLLNAPNIMSPANGIAAFWYRRQCETLGNDTKYRDTVRRMVYHSQQYAKQMNIQLPLTRDEYCVKHKPESEEKAESVDSSYLFYGNDSEDEEDDEDMEAQEGAAKEAPEEEEADQQDYEGADDQEYEETEEADEMEDGEPKPKKRKMEEVLGE